MTKTSVNDLQTSITALLPHTQQYRITFKYINIIWTTWLPFHIFAHNIFIEYSHLSKIYYFQQLHVYFLPFTQLGIRDCIYGFSYKYVTTGLRTVITATNVTDYYYRCYYWVERVVFCYVHAVDKPILKVWLSTT